MRGLSEYTNIKKLFIMIVSTISIMISLSFVLSFTGSKEVKTRDSISKVGKNKANNIKKVGISEKYKVKSEPKVNVYFVNERIVKAIPLEEYVMGVVSAEMPAEFHVEALKAQAVAARTYALAHMKDFGDNQYNKNIGADVCDSVQSQVFMPKNKRLKSWPESKRKEYWNKVEQCINSTKGNVLVYDNDIAMAPYYFATSNGQTEDCENVFSSKVPYLRSVKSVGEEKAPKFKTDKKISYDEVVNKIKKQYPKCDINNENMKNKIQIKDRTTSGSVKNIKISNIEIKGTEFRKILGLNSAKFDFKFTSKYLVVTCNGYGHNVGMSQWGANSMAKAGKKYDDILKHYYQGVNIEIFKY